MSRATTARTAARAWMRRARRVGVVSESRAGRATRGGPAPRPPQGRRRDTPDPGAPPGTRGRPNSKAVLSPLGLTLASVAALVIFLGIALVTGFLAPPGSSSRSGGSPAQAQVVAHAPAASMVFDDGTAWLADDQGGNVRRLDPASGSLLGRPTRVGVTPIALAAGYGRVWVADTSANEVSGLDPRTARVVTGPVAVPEGPVSIVSGAGGVWVASLLAGTVSLIDPRSGQVTASVALPDGAVRIALGDGDVWVTGKQDTLTRIDPRPLGVTLTWRAVTVGQGPIGVAVGAGAVWVADAQSSALTRVDPHTLAVTGTSRIDEGSSSGAPGAIAGSDPETVAVWRDRVWVGLGGKPTVIALDPVTGLQVGKAVPLPGVVRQFVVDPTGDLWAATADPGSEVRLDPS